MTKLICGGQLVRHCCLSFDSSFGFRISVFMNLDDTIVAVSSPVGAGERAILRLSGPRAIAMADEVFHAGAPGVRLAEQPTFTARAGRLEVAGLSVPATVYLMRAPRSYTRQDVVEFHVGAWPAVTGDLVAGLVAAGARPAEPGEFTFRALMSGRLDLAQAEAVMAVIEAADRATLRAAGDLLAGHLSRQVEPLVEDVRQVLALVEVGLDFSDQDLELVPLGEIAAALDAAGLALADLGRRARGIETFSGRVRLVVAGRPNAGKSSLFNRLLAEESGDAGPARGRAIVSPEAGTTRDELQATLLVDGLEFTLSDTAGLAPALQALGAGPGASSREEERFRGDDIAAQAQAKALAAIGGADLVLVAIDAAGPSPEEAAEILSLAAAPGVVAVTKCDLSPPDRVLKWLAGRPEIGPVAAVATSAVTGRGIETLRQALVRAVRGGAVDRQAAGPVVTARHRAAMEQAAGALARAAALARSSAGGGGELVAVELREALDALGSILGRRADADILGAIFSRFCVGK
jgi:tRNA modification GTPase